MALAGNIKAPTAAMLLLALVVAVAAMSPPDTVDGQPAVVGMAKAGSGRRSRGGGDDGQKQKPLPAGLTSCVTICGTQMTTCSVDCYKPGNLVALPLCLFRCSNNAVSCAGNCSSNII